MAKISYQKHFCPLPWAMTELGDQWSEKWQTDPAINHLEIREKNGGRPVSVEFCRKQDGRHVDADSIEVIRHPSRSDL